MKLETARVEAFLRDPAACRVVLLHGDDAGMIRDRAIAMVRAVAGALDDPFLVVELTRDEIGRLPDEAASMSLTGGRRVVRVREVTDAAAIPHVRTVLKSKSPAFVVLEGPGLPARHDCEPSWKPLQTAPPSPVTPRKAGRWSPPSGKL